MERNEHHGSEIAQRMAEHGIVGDLEAAHGIARWAYGRAQALGALLWVRKRETRTFPPNIALPI